MSITEKVLINVRTPLIRTIFRVVKVVILGEQYANCAQVLKRSKEVFDVLYVRQFLPNEVLYEYCFELVEKFTVTDF